MFEIRRNLKNIIKKHIAFTERKEVRRPLLCINVIGRNYAQVYSNTFSNIPKNREVKPEDIILEYYLKDVDNFINLHEEVGTDMFYPVVPFWFIPWTEAIIGCPIFAGKDSFYAEPFIKNWSDFKKSFNILDRNMWFEKLIEINSALVDYLGDRYPIGSSTHLRGPVDMMAASLGQNEFPLQLYDNLDNIKIMSKVFTNVFIDIASSLNNIAKKSKFEGFIVNYFGIWTKEICQYYQDDAIAFLSPHFYKDFVIKDHINIDQSFPSTLYHVHPISLFVIDELIKFPKLKIIEINREPKAIGPSTEKMLPVFKKIQKNKKAVLINFTDVNFSPSLIEEEVRLIYKNLSLKGLCIFVSVGNIKDGIEKINAIKKVFKV